MSSTNRSEEVVLLHNPACSKSRATAAILAEAGIAFTERLYLEEPLDELELEALAAKLDRHPREWVRRGQAEYVQAGLDANSSPEAHFAAMAAAPILMERPIVVVGERARVGRPPSSVLELFD